jgi:K+-sensing histidine kinase KdpD
VLTPTSAPESYIFFSQLAHDLQNPLATLMANSRYFVDELKSQPSLQEAAYDMVHSGGDLYRMVQNIVVLGREGAEFPLRPEPVDIDKVFSQLQAHFAGPAKDRHQKIVTNVGAKSIFADSTHLRLVLENLIECSLRYAPTRSDITLSSHDGERGGFVSVTDSGPNVPSELIEKIFSRRECVLVKEKTRYSRAFGLPVCHSVMLAHGGHISTEAVGTLTRFNLFFPAQVERD